MWNVTGCGVARGFSTGRRARFLVRLPPYHLVLPIYQLHRHPPSDATTTAAYLIGLCVRMFCG
jgi:hypothetical protein